MMAQAVRAEFGAIDFSGKGEGVARNAKGSLY